MDRGPKTVLDLKYADHGHKTYKRPPRSRTDELLHDIINLADEAARLALGENGEETEDEDFM